jgi:hypothetical protein
MNGYNQRIDFYALLGYFLKHLRFVQYSKNTK